MVTDGLGNLLRFLLSGGNRNDIYMAQALLEPFELDGKLILGDKGYDSDKFCQMGRGTGRDRCHTELRHRQVPQEDRLVYIKNAT